MKITIMSSFSDALYEKYAKVFLESVEKYLDSDIDFLLYMDDIKLDFSKNKNWTRLNLEQSCPKLVEFKLRHKDRLPGDHAVRFSHKSYAICHAGKNIKTDILIWLDADTIIFNNITKDYLLRFLPNGYFTSFLGRKGRYTETGFVAFDLRNKYSREFFDQWEWHYDTDNIFKLSGQLDCQVFDAAKDKLAEDNKIKLYDLTPGMSKSNFNHTFKGYMRHYKGDDKKKMVNK